MPFRPLLDSGRVVLVDAPGPATRDDAIDLAASHLARHSGLDAALLRQALREREALASTGIGFGLALPHARQPGLEEDIGVFLKLPRALDFHAADQRAVDLVFAMVVDDGQVQRHLRRLAAIAERFADPAFCSALRRAGSQRALARLLLQADPQGAAVSSAA
ncbi:PTS sugar transporter subunit IIA [Lysobacter sp. SG-8]|uniref:PTS sugar transporter subunit IIA n=1 Tax=Marilutibacter penaei TaxID=2759900 RepID=A0A7W3U393_9GAMM|nr:PTS sugar transporter subunit IIA [Lysobacter penaei]MBB1088151.1 PTS sugar transporter subunit IIA [Lysobacter penaei]